MKKIPLTQNKEALVSDSDYKALSQYKWHLVSTGYPATLYRGNRHFTMHRMITDAPKSRMVDHINGNILDNRRNNLRLVTVAQSNKNRSGRKNSSSQYKGVSWDTRTRNWIVQIRSDKKTIFGGRHNDERAAAQEYNRLAEIYHGKFARLNNV